MKRILALALCLCLCVCLFGCSDSEGSGGGGLVSDGKIDKVAGKTPEELYAAALDELKAATSFEATTTQKIVMSAQGETVTMNQTAISKQNGYDVYFKTENDMSPQAEMEVTYVNGVYYLKQSGQKYKKNISHSEMDEMIAQMYGGGTAADQTLLSIPEEWFKDVTFEMDGSSYTMTIKVAAEKYTELMGNMGISGATFTSDVEYKVYFDANGRLQKTIATFTFDVSGVACDCVSTSIITIADVKISAPADADSYTSLD